MSLEVVTARFPSTCATCTRKIHPGVPIVDAGHRGPQGGVLMSHARCGGVRSKALPTFAFDNPKRRGRKRSRRNPEPLIKAPTGSCTYCGGKYADLYRMSTGRSQGCCESPPCLAKKKAKSERIQAEARDAERRQRERLYGHEDDWAIKNPASRPVDADIRRGTNRELERDVAFFTRQKKASRDAKEREWWNDRLVVARSEIRIRKKNKTWTEARKPKQAASKGRTPKRKTAKRKAAANPRYTPIARQFPARNYEWGKAPRVANWTSYPQYSYDQFYRANPASRPVEASIRIGSNRELERDVVSFTKRKKAARDAAERVWWDDHLKVARDEIRVRKKAGTWTEARKPKTTQKASRGRTTKRKTVKAKPAAKKARRNSGEDIVRCTHCGKEVRRKHMNDHTNDCVLKTAPESWRGPKVVKDEDWDDRWDDEDLLFNPRRRRSARRNGLSKPIYTEMPDNAGPFVPGMYPGGSGGYPASYEEIPAPGSEAAIAAAAAQKNPRRRKRRR